MVGGAFAFASSASEGGEGGAVLSYLKIDRDFETAAFAWSINDMDDQPKAINFFESGGSVYMAVVEGSQLRYYDTE